MKTPSTKTLPPLTRRQFLLQTSGVAAGLGWAIPRLALAQGSANAKLNIGFVGVANRAAANLAEVAKETASVNVAALCDVDENYLAHAKQQYPRARTYHDFRRLLEQKDLDAVVISTPDHTHAVAASAALRTGRHVYCEKPLTRTVSESRVVANLTREHRRVTQLGTQIHAGNNYRRVVELVQSQILGPIREVHVWVGAVYGGMDRPKDTPPVPPGLDWDLWLGPVEYRPYHPEYAPFKWRNWWAFGGGSIADFGCHFMDLPHWALSLRHPTSVEPVDGPPVHPESTPPWLIVRYQYPARPLARAGESLPPVTLTWYHGGRKPSLLDEEQAKYFGSGVLFVGEKGSLLADYTRRQLLPEARFADFAPPAPSIPNSIGHHKEWIEAIQSGGPTTCNFDYSGALTEAALLGNVAYRLGQKIVWDAPRLHAVALPAAQELIQHRYRPGWQL
ncbi:MAG: Gfo/Idh/MocA family oxidoreductase [Verrucomicrobia bacterium]|nr:Gfo/Idh/MocA family oxidoreductase [Verrucomicrobiota bacterium]